MKDSYANKKVYLGSQHKKELAIAQVLSKGLNISLIPAPWDTDAFGTFSGEIKRKLSIRDTLRAKAENTHKIYKADLVLVSEGSFGPHPQIPLINSNHEMLLLKDFSKNREIFAQTIGVKTNIDEIELTKFEDAKEFLKRSRFGSHGMIIADRKENPLYIKKGIISLAELKKEFHKILKDYQKVYLSTDMRAHMNPTRMKVIRKAAGELVKMIKSICPQCQCPGWDVVDYVEGLPCSQCELPSTTIKELVYKCQECGYKENKPRLDKKAYIAPDHCEFCNP